MNDTDIQLIQRFAVADLAQKVADLGSYAVHGRSVKTIIPHHDVTGFDIVPGPAVDVVLPIDGWCPGEHCGRYDVVFALSTIQFARDPGAVVWEACQLCRPGTGIAVFTCCHPRCQDEHNTSMKHRDKEWRPSMGLLLETVGRYLTIEEFNDGTGGGTQWVQAVRR